MQLFQLHYEEFVHMDKEIPSIVQPKVALLIIRVIIVNKAPAPREIIWENLRFSYIRSLIFEIMFIAVMILLLGGALRTILFFMNYSLTFRIEGQ